MKNFLDDLLIYSDTWEEHLLHIRIVLERLRTAGLRLVATKCFWGRPEVLFLGVILSGGSTRPNPKLVTAVNEFPRPTTVKQLQGFLGMCNFFRNYICEFAHIAVPLYDLVKGPAATARKGSAPKSITQQWDDTHEAAFLRLKRALADAPTLTQPDWEEIFYLHTDYSGTAIGAVLTQVDPDGHHRPIGFASRVLSKAEKNYSATEGECLALMWGVEFFRHYLHGHHFHIYTDAQALQFLLGGQAAKSSNRKHHRWLAELQSYDFDIEHKPGTDNIVPDVLSRCLATRIARGRGATPPTSATLAASLATLEFTLHSRAATWHGIQPSIGSPSEPGALHSELAASYLIAMDRQPNHPLPEAAVRAIERESGRPTRQPTTLDARSASLSAMLADGTSDLLLVLPDVADLAYHTTDNAWVSHLAHCDILRVIAPADPAGVPYIVVARAAYLGSRPVDVSRLPTVTDIPVRPLEPERPIHLMELCGGIATFLEACLRNGLSVSRYTYSDASSMARQAAHRRITRLQRRYPRQLPAAAIEEWTSVSQDVHQITAPQLASLPPVDLLAAGPPCQPFSQAGNRKGFLRKDAWVFPEVIRIARQIFEAQGYLSYVIENVKGAVDNTYVRHMVGDPVFGRAELHGSGARRDTLFWTNLGDRDSIQAHLDVPTGHRPAALILREHGWSPEWQLHAGSPEFLNKFVSYPGSYAHRMKPDGVTPGPAMLWHAPSKTYREAPARMREHLMSLSGDDTAVPTFTDRHRCELIGASIDPNLATALIAGGILTRPPIMASSVGVLATHRCCGGCAYVRPGRPLHTACLFECRCCTATHAALQARPPAVLAVTAAAPEFKSLRPPPTCHHCLSAGSPESLVACAGCHRWSHLQCLTPPRSTAPSGDFFCPACDPLGISGLTELFYKDTPLRYTDTDPYQDIALLDALDGDMPETPTEQRRVAKRMATHRRHPLLPHWLQYRRGSHAPWVTCPPIEYRLDLVRCYHEHAGHPGHASLYHSMRKLFWWPDLRRDVRDYTRSCDNCQRATSLAAPLKDPQPFDLYGPFQHILMDSCGPFLLPPERPPGSAKAKTEKSAKSAVPASKDSASPAPPPARKAWILVIVDYFTKVAEFAILYEHSASAVASAAYEHWISRYPRPIKWTTDCGTENLGAFAALCKSLGILHITTAVFNPTANGGAERLVGTIKHMLQRLVGTHLESWPRMLPLARGAYMRHVHSATGVSPMEMALGIGDPAIPPLSPALLAAYVSVITGLPEGISASGSKSDRISGFDIKSNRIISAAVADILQFTPDLDAVLQPVYAIDPPDPTAILRHVESSADHRASLHSRARHSLMRAQAGHRLRHHRLLQQRHVPPVYEVRPDDYVLITARNPQGLRPKMQGPFKVLRVTSQGNVFIQSAPSRPGKPAPQWSVRADRVVPYRFAHHTNVSHPSVGTACILPPSRLPQPTTSDFFYLFYASASTA